MLTAGVCDFLPVIITPFMSFQSGLSQFLKSPHADKVEFLQLTAKGDHSTPLQQAENEKLRCGDHDVCSLSSLV